MKLALLLIAYNIIVFYLLLNNNKLKDLAHDMTNKYINELGKRQLLEEMFSVDMDDTDFFDEEDEEYEEFN